jgi:hypothetical protein
MGRSPAALETRMDKQFHVDEVNSIPEAAFRNKMNLVDQKTVAPTVLAIAIARHKYSYLLRKIYIQLCLNNVWNMRFSIIFTLLLSLSLSFSSWLYIITLLLKR